MSKTKLPFLVFGLLFIGVIGVFPHAAKADTFCTGGYHDESGWGNGQTWVWDPCIYSYSETYSANPVAPNQVFSVSGSITTDMCANEIFGTYGQTDYATLSITPSWGGGTQTVAQGSPAMIVHHTSYGSSVSYTVPYTAPSSPGSYYMRFVGSGQTYENGYHLCTPPTYSCTWTWGGGQNCQPNYCADVYTGTAVYDMSLSVYTPPGTVQGYKLTNSYGVFDPGATISVSGGGSSAGTDPYFITNTPAGWHTVSSSIPAGYSVSYQVKPTGGGDGQWHSGSSASVNVPAGAGADVWWMYTPIPSAPSDVSSISYACSASGNQATFSWPAPSGANEYQIQYYSSSGSCDTTGGYTLWTDGHTCYKDFWSSVPAGQTVSTVATIPVGQTTSAWVNAANSGAWANWGGQPSTGNFTCTPSCTGGRTWNSGSCSCPSSLPNWNGSSCVACTGGQTWNGGSCSCASPTVWSGGSCVTPGTTCTTTSGYAGTWSASGSCIATVPTVDTFYANPNTVDAGQTTTLYWTSTNADYCEETPGTTGFAHAGHLQPNGNTPTVSLLPPASSCNGSGQCIMNFSLTCVGPAGPSPARSASVTVMEPGITISASPERVPYGGSTTVSWNATNVNSCSLEKNSKPWNPSGVVLTANSGRVVKGSATDSNITNQTTYTITCVNNVTSISASANLSASTIVNVITNYNIF